MGSKIPVTYRAYAAHGRPRYTSPSRDVVAELLVVIVDSLMTSGMDVNPERHEKGGHSHKLTPSDDERPLAVIAPAPTEASVDWWK